MYSKNLHQSTLYQTLQSPARLPSLPCHHLFTHVTLITLITLINFMLSRVYTSIPDKQLLSIYTQTDKSSKQCSTRGYMEQWRQFCRRYRIHVDGDKGYKSIQLVSGLHVSGHLFRCKCGIIQTHLCSTHDPVWASRDMHIHREP